MRRLIEYIRLVFVSLEFVFALMLSILAYCFPVPIGAMGSALRGSSEVMKWIPVLSLAICGIIARASWRLTAPSSVSNRELYDWPEYWRLACRRNVSITLGALCVMLAVSLWIFSDRLSDLFLGYIFLLSLGVAVIDMACIVFAGFKIREIMEQ